MPYILPKISPTYKAGCCLLVHGDTNGGKTHAALTAPKKILVCNKEPKDPRLLYSTVDPNYADYIDVVEFQDFDDEQDTLNKLIECYLKGNRPYETIFNDGLTFSMGNIKSKLEQDRYHAMELEDKEDKQPRPGLVDMAPTIMKDWGTLASLTARNVKLYHQLSKFGVLVVTTAISDEYPKWNKSVRIAPSLLGKEFPRFIHGWYDTIGYLVQPFQINRGEIIQPRVSFVSSGTVGLFGSLTNSYMVRANPRLIAAEQKYGPIILDLSIIVGIIRGEVAV